MIFLLEYPWNYFPAIGNLMLVTCAVARCQVEKETKKGKSLKTRKQCLGMGSTVPNFQLPWWELTVSTFNSCW
jgi:hypothetical protein